MVAQRAQLATQQANLATHPQAWTTLNTVHQAKHTVGSATQRGSILLEDAKALYAQYGGLGAQVNPKIARGMAGFRERIQADGIIGLWHNQSTNALVYTDRAIIHYSNKGYHLVPAQPSANVLTYLPPPSAIP